MKELNVILSSISVHSSDGGLILTGKMLHCHHFIRTLNIRSDMKQLKRGFAGLGLIFALVLTLQAQNNPAEASRFDYGKMWTFEHAPLDYFQETYDFRPNDEWLERARLSALRFASFCSASFISPNGLILTNHHCSRGVVGDLMQEGEDFDKNGFYATTQEEERRAEGLFVKQLVKIEDITNQVNEMTADAANEEEMKQKQAAALEQILESYKSNPDWQGLEPETVTYYSGGKFSVYGYKRYDDIRLVLIPELQLGYFGGDPDNFTYPRYALDFTLWRAYENGKPVNTSEFHFPVLPEGAVEGDPVFVIGNPGSTERYRSVAQLEYDRDYRYNIQLAAYNSMMSVMEAQYEAEPSHDLQETMFSLGNSIKAITGIVEGMHNPRLMNRKVAMESKIRMASTKDGSRDYWAELEALYEPLQDEAMEVTLLSPGRLGGNTVVAAHVAHRYKSALEEGASEEELAAMKGQVMQIGQMLQDPYEQQRLTNLLTMASEFADADDTYVSELLAGQSPAEAANRILEGTAFGNPEELEKLLGKDKKVTKSKDPILQMGDLIVPAYQNAAVAFQSSGAQRKGLEQLIANEVFKVYGLNIPPDATFTLRFADGVVKGYDYNGTQAPFFTTYFGLYDRSLSHNQTFPWSLPERWQNPPMGLLKAPMNFVSTSDSIGGNSGSPVINKNRQLVGLLFDGNIESLPGNFIYDIEYNRSVNVHAGGIVAAMRYIYGANRILSELNVE